MANLKQLSQIPEKLSSGHRLCAGCGASIAVRQILMATTDPVIVGAATGCLEVATTIYPYTAWEVPFIHNAFENAAATMSGVETAYRAFKKKNKITKDIKFVAFGGDGGTYDIGLQSLSGMLERGHNVLYVCYDNQAYMNCLSTSSLIMTKDGLKKITELKVGDPVYAFDQKTYLPVLKKCSGIFDNGHKEIFEVTTLHHTIKATANHPFLTLQRNGRGKENSFIWKRVDQLINGDQVVVLKYLNSGKSCNFKINKVRKGDYKVNRINDIYIPDKSSPDLMKYLGLFVGDGWIRAKKGETGFAIPEKTRAREILLNLHKKLFDSKVRLDPEYVYINSVNLTNFIQPMGFGQSAKTKTIPSWIYTLPDVEKDAFIEGLTLSDGYKLNKSVRYVSSSKDLLERLRLLLQTLNYRVGKIHLQKKLKGTKCVYRKLLKDSEYGYICFSRKQKWNIQKYPLQYKYQNFLINNPFFEMAEIRDIKSLGIEPTLDLRVEDEHNFIANGFVVHNTGIQRSGATPCGASTTTAPAGKVIPGKPQMRKDLTAIAAAHNIPYVAQATISHWNDLVTKAQKAFAANGPAFLNVLSPCHRGWRYPMEETVSIAKLAVETGFWPLYEVENGKWRMTVKVRERKPIIEWLKLQGRFKHLLKPENTHIIESIQKDIDGLAAKLEKLCS